MKVRNIVLTAAFGLLALPALAASPQKPGQWQITMEMDMPGMPFKMPPMKHTLCLTQEDVDNPQKSLPKDEKSNCKISDYKVDGQTVTWSVKCEGKQPMTGNGEITFDGDSYKGWTKMKMSDDQEMSMKYSGKRLGDCTK
jgi:hypothetical protein